MRLTRGPGDYQGSPRWSPDGRRIVFDSRGEDGYKDVWTIDVGGGSPRRVTGGPLTEAMASWSRDGRWIYYRAERPDGSDIWRIPDGGGTPERLTHNGGLLARESANGKTLFYTQRDGTSPLFSLPLAGGPERQVADCVVSRSLAEAIAYAMAGRCADPETQLAERIELASRRYVSPVRVNGSTPPSVIWTSASTGQRRPTRSGRMA